jgi:hypothetical protein
MKLDPARGSKVTLNGSTSNSLIDFIVIPGYEQIISKRF